MTQLISHEEVQEKIKKIPDWEFNETSISRVFEFDEYLSAIDFVNSVAEIAEEAYHHPDILINYTNVKLTLSTHEVGGITDRDFEVAERIDSLE